MTDKLTAMRQELRRRRVFRVVLVYATVSFVAWQAAEILEPALSLPSFTVTLVVVLTLLGFPVAIGLAWALGATAGPAATSTPDTAHESMTAATASAAHGSRKSILVLPFANVSVDPGDEYFSDGLTDEVITDLSSLRSLRVISRSSAMALKGSRKDVRTIGRELGVQYVVEGSVRKAGDDLRITAELIDARNDEHLWVERYSGTIEDVFDMQERVSRSIARALRVELSPHEADLLTARPIEDVRAYDCYLRARQEALKFTPEALDRAASLLDSGLAITGDNAMLFAGLAYVQSQYANIGARHEEAIAKAQQYATRALELDANSAEAHLVLGFVNQAFLGDQKTSLRHLGQALRLRPDDPHALIWTIVGYTVVGRTAEAYTLMDRLRQVDPLTPMNNWPAFVPVMDGRFDLPAAELTFWFDREPDNPGALFFSAMWLAFSGHLAEAHDLVRTNVHAGWTDNFTRLAQVVQLAVERAETALRELLQGDFARSSRRDPQSSYFVGSLLALAGMKDEAMDWIANAVERGFVNHPFMARHDPLLETLRKDARFQALLSRVHTAWESMKSDSD